jgi:group I intron endonuclease
MQQLYALYIATNTVNGRQYVGLTGEYKKRMISHKCAKTKSMFHQAIRQYGFDKFVFTHIADAFDLQSACDIERFLIQQHNTLAPNGYNMTVGGQMGAFAGKKHTPETKAKIGEANRRRDPESRQRAAMATRGRVVSEEFRANASVKMKEVWAKRRAAKEQADKLLSNLTKSEVPTWINV